MPFKSKTKLERFEYQSPDGDDYSIVYVTTDDREYIKIFPADKDEKEFPMWDVELILDLADHIKSQKMPKSFPAKRGSKTGLAKPKIKDHRTPTVPTAEQVKMAVEATDENKAWSKFRTGVDVENMGELEETPEDLKITGSSDEPKWKKDAADRSNKEKPNVKSYGSEGKNFGRKARISHQEII